MDKLLKPDELARYAETIVRGCLSVGEGDDLIVTAQPAHRELTIALVEAAYRAGARAVEISVDDPLVRAARVRNSSDGGLGAMAPWQIARVRATIKPKTATLLVVGEGEPGALEGIPPETLAADVVNRFKQMPWLQRAARANKRRWAIAAWPTDAWATRVYPKLKPLNAKRKLARDLLWFSRVGPDDPPGHEGWTQHLRALERRARRLTKLELRRLELRGAGTALDLQLHSDTLFQGGGEKNAYGYYMASNIPTEECYASPVATGTEGTFRCSRPLAFQGRVIDGIAGEFRGGRLVRLEAARDDDRDFLAAMIASIDDADRLGEVALVDNSSRIGQTRRIYLNTLLDENAAAHIALGAGFPETRRDEGQTRGRRGVNRSRLHLDVMIGTDDLEATGITEQGKRVPLIADGTWQI